MDALSLFRDLALGGFLFILPGWALLKYFGPARDLSWKIKAGLAPGLSLAVYPILFLIARWIHVPVTGLAAALPGLLAVLALAWSNRKFSIKKKGVPARDSIYFLILIAAIFVARMLVVRGMEAPPWGDSVHHTMIVRLLVENKGLFSSWMPYAPMITFTYHFGFHAAAAAWAMVAGVPAITAVLAVGQVLNVMAVLALYPIGVKLGRSAWAGLGAVGVAGLFSLLPGFAVNWGRYTQLVAQVILPVLIWFLVSFWRDSDRPKTGTIGLTALLFAGIFFSHYRVLLVAAAAAAAWSARALWEYRKKLGDWFGRAWRLAISGLTAALVAVPWIINIAGGRASRQIQMAMGSGGRSAATDLGLWTRLGFYIGPVFWIAGAAAFVFALVRNRKLAFDLAAWIGLAFLAANPQLLGLPGAGLESNFILIAGLYVPIAWLIGSAVGEAAGRLDRAGAGRIIAAVVFAGALIFGFGRQERVADPFFRMVEPNDVAAFRWIRMNTPTSARIMVNAYLAFNDSLAVGSDAGWWIPYFTKRPTPVLPLQFSTEKLPPGTDPRASRQLVLDLRATGGNPEKMADLFIREGLSYAYLGERRGSVGYGAVELLPEAWFRYNPYFVRVARFGAAEVWRFKK